MNFFHCEIKWFGVQCQHPTRLALQTLGAAQLEVREDGGEEGGDHVVDHLVPHAGPPAQGVGLEVGWLLESSFCEKSLWVVFVRLIPELRMEV